MGLRYGPPIPQMFALTDGHSNILCLGAFPMGILHRVLGTYSYRFIC